MISTQQIRAARSFLEWSQAELGKRAGLSQTAIANIERGHFRPTVKSLEAIQGACEQGGVEFIEGGIRLKSSYIRTLKGPDFEVKMQDFKYLVCRDQGIREVLYLGLNPTLMPPDHLARTRRHMQRMKDLGVKTRALVSDKRIAEELPGDLKIYRALPDHYVVDTSPVFIMGNYLGLMLYDVQEVVIIRNENQANFQRHLFDYLWDQGKKIKAG